MCYWYSISVQYIFSPSANHKMRENKVFYCMLLCCLVFTAPSTSVYMDWLNRGLWTHNVCVVVLENSLVLYCLLLFHSNTPLRTWQCPPWRLSVCVMWGCVCVCMSECLYVRVYVLMHVYWVIQTLLAGSVAVHEVSWDFGPLFILSIFLFVQTLSQCADPADEFYSMIHYVCDSTQWSIVSVIIMEKIMDHDAFAPHNEVQPLDMSNVIVSSIYAILPHYCLAF